MKSLVALLVCLSGVAPVRGQEMAHHHPPPEHLGRVRFATSCTPDVTTVFDRSVALLHSFAYEAADQGFAEVAARDPGCAMAYWGRAMAHYHQLWDAPSGEALTTGAAEIERAQSVGAKTDRERRLIAALATYYSNSGSKPAAERARLYSDAMAAVYRDYPRDEEVAVFYALSLVATAPPSDRTHGRQKRAADILEPIWKRQPDHPGVPHYLIHAYDSAELARRGLPAARAYAKIAPSAPHALHMPSHIFTRLGLWDDSIASNIAARDAARAQGDVGEQLHAMDYLTYAYLQKGQKDAAAAQISDLRTLAGVDGGGFKIGYAANAMPVRLAVETQDWTAASQLRPISGSSPQVAAIVWWARALGKLRGAPARSADDEIARLQRCREALRLAGNDYWMAQTDVLLKSALAWQSLGAGDRAAAVAGLSAAADEEDALEKLPLTPGPIVPAREQLGEMLLALDRPRDAEAAFEQALTLAPGRRGALTGEAEAQRRLGTAA